MIKLKSIIEEMVDPEVQFSSPDEVEFDYYEDLNKLERKSGIGILSDKQLSMLAILDGKVVGALYTGISNDEFSFDVIADKTLPHKGIGPRLIDMGLAEGDDLASGGYIMKLDVVNRGVEKYLLSKGLKVVDRIGHHTIMTR